MRDSQLEETCVHAWATWHMLEWILRARVETGATSGESSGRGCSTKFSEGDGVVVDLLASAPSREDVWEGTANTVAATNRSVGDEVRECKERCCWAGAGMLGMERGVERIERGNLHRLRGNTPSNKGCNKRTGHWSTGIIWDGSVSRPEEGVS